LQPIKTTHLVFFIEEELALAQEQNVKEKYQG
jgi:hypothetical protein